MYILILLNCGFLVYFIIHYYRNKRDNPIEIVVIENEETTVFHITLREMADYIKRIQEINQQKQNVEYQIADFLYENICPICKNEYIIE